MDIQDAAVARHDCGWMESAVSRVQYLNTKFNLMFFDSYFRVSGEVEECPEVSKVCHHILDLLSVAKGRCNCAKFQINAADARHENLSRRRLSCLFTAIRLSRWNKGT